MPKTSLQHIPHPNHRLGCAAVSDGRTVYISQLTACTAGADIRTQTAHCLALLEGILRQAGSTPATLLRVEFTVADSRCIPAVCQVWQRWQPQPLPTPIWRFGRLPGALVAVDAIAAVD